MNDSLHRVICRRSNLLGAALVLLCAWATAAAEDPPLPRIDSVLESPTAGDEAASHFVVTAQILPASNTEPLRLAISATVPDGWHIFSITQKPGGPKRTRIDLDPSQRFKLAAPLKAAPAAHAKEYPDFWPNLPVEEHEHAVVWTAPIELAAGVDPALLTISGRVRAQLCSNLCLDVERTFTAKLGQPVAPQAAPGKSPAPASAPPVPKASAPRPAQSPAGSAQITFKSDFLTLTGSLSMKTVAPGGNLQLELVAQPKSGWHMYALADRAPERADEARPTLIDITQRGGLKVGAPVADRPVTMGTATAAGLPVAAHYQGRVRFIVPVQVPAGTPPGEYEISGLVGYQTCSDSMCDTPQAASFSVAVKVEPESKAGSVPVRFASSKYSDVAQAIAQGGAWDKVAARPVVTAPVEEESANFSAGTLGVNLVFAFFGGLILNLMPCVLPVIGLKIMTFVEQAGESRGRVLALNVWFTLGVVAVFLGLGALAAFTTLGWSGQFQQVGFKIPLAAVVFAFALSLMGVWEIPLPGFVGSHAAHQIAEREGASGAFAKGVLSTLLATPCVGPFMAGPLTWTSNMNSVPLTFAIFGTMGLGMAAPYLLIGARPSLVRFLPKPGAWMETFKHLMGFVLLATVVWIFWTIPPRFFVPTLALLFGIWLGCWWVGRTPLTAELREKLTAYAIATALSAAVGLAAFHWLAEASPTTTAVAQAHGVWQPFTPAALRDLRDRRVPVLIDFTAKWCLTCQANKLTALHTKATEQYMRDHGIVGLIADKTDEAPDVDHLLVELGHTSKVIPFYAVFPADGGPVVTYNQGPLFQGTLLKLLKKAGSATTESNTSATVSAPTLSATR